MNHSTTAIYAQALETEIVTEFWKIILMGAPETIKIFKFTMVLLTAENTFQVFLISQLILVIQSILLEH